jgi:hypothetical protein
VDLSDAKVLLRSQTTLALDEKAILKEHGADVLVFEPKRKNAAFVVIEKLGDCPVHGFQLLRHRYKLGAISLNNV